MEQGTEPTLNEMFRDFVDHYHMTALPAGPYKPKHSLAEGAVKIIYRTIFSLRPVKQNTYFSLADLNIAISGKHLRITTASF